MAGVQSVLLALTLSCALSFTFAQRNPAPGQFLYVATGDQDKVQNDQLVVLQFNRSAVNYGRVVTTVSLLSRGNEPKLVASNRLNTELVLGGFLTFVTGQSAGQRDTYFFNLTRPSSPVLGVRTSVAGTGLPAFFVPKNNGGWVGTRMGNTIGDSPGKLVEFAPGPLKTLVGQAGPATAFNPHGLDIREDKNIAITTDFLNPRSAVFFLGAPRIPLNVTLRSTFRVWTLSTRLLRSTVAVPDRNAGLLDVKFIPGDLTNRAFVTGAFSGKIYIVTVRTAPTLNATVATAIDLRPLFAGRNPGPAYITLVPKYRVLFVTLTFDGSVAMLSYANPVALRYITRVSLGVNSHPSYLEAFKRDDRLAVSTYFLDLKFPGATPAIPGVRASTPFGNINLNGTRTVRVLQFTNATLFADPKWPSPNFNTLFPTSGIQTPHGLAYYPAY